MFTLCRFIDLDTGERSPYHSIFKSSDGRSNSTEHCYEFEFELPKSGYAPLAQEMVHEAQTSLFGASPPVEVLLRYAGAGLFAKVTSLTRLSVILRFNSMHQKATPWLK